MVQASLLSKELLWVQISRVSPAYSVNVFFVSRFWKKWVFLPFSFIFYTLILKGKNSNDLQIYSINYKYMKLVFAKLHEFIFSNQKCTCVRFFTKYHSFLHRITYLADNYYTLLPTGHLGKIFCVFCGRKTDNFFVIKYCKIFSSFEMI